MKTITFYSYKGGVGRSLALSNVAHRLSEFGKKVCIIDFDLEAPGVHLKFEEYIYPRTIKNGLVDYIYDFSKHSKVPENITDYVTNIAFEQGANKSDISLIAAGNTLSKDYWRRLSTINWNNFFYDKSSLGVPFFYNLKEQIRTQINPDILLIDSRTGITDISGITMSIFADEVVLLAANNKENLEGIGQVIKTLAIPENSLGNKVPKIHFVLSRIPFFILPKDKPREMVVRNSALNLINKVIEDGGINDFKITKSLVLHSDPDLEMQEKFKISYNKLVEIDSFSSPIGLDYLELFEEITSDIISVEDKKEFEQFIRSESLIQKALTNSDNLERVRGLKAALKINPNSIDGHFYLSQTYLNIKQLDKSMESIEEALGLSPKVDAKLLKMKASILIELRKFSLAIEIYNSILKGYPTDYGALMDLAVCYYRTGEYQLSMEINLRTLTHYSMMDAPWNSYGNNLKMLGDLERALDVTYKAFEMDPQNPFTATTLAEIYGLMGNTREFYKNLELAFSFGLTSDQFTGILEFESVYQKHMSEEKFIAMLEKYNIEVSGKE